MAIDDKHPLYFESLGYWLQMEDTYKGEREVKKRRTNYLPPSKAMLEDGMNTPNAPGWQAYEGYIRRAVYHDLVKDAVKAMIGMMHNKPAEIRVPKKLEPMLKYATKAGEGLQMLLRRINEYQLVYGRVGLLADVPSNQDVVGAIPYVAVYEPKHIINWDAGVTDEGRQVLELVVLDETGFARTGFSWQIERKHRVLARGLPGTTYGGSTRPGPDSPYRVCVKINSQTTPTPAEFITPQIGGNYLKEIPFVFVGANDMVPEPDQPPLLGLSNLALAVYRGEADYRQTLFMQGQDTLTLIGARSPKQEVEGNKTQRVGAGSVITLPIGGDAKYVGVSAKGLSEMRSAIENDIKRAEAVGSSMLDIQGIRGESGEALRIRVAARTTTISTVAQTSAAGLEKILRYCAEFVGANPDEVSVIANTDFADATLTGQQVLFFMQSKAMGAPLALKSIHSVMRKNDLTEMTYEEEMDTIAEEGGFVGPPGPGVPGVVDASLTDKPKDAQTNADGTPRKSQQPQPAAVPPTGGVK